MITHCEESACRDQLYSVLNSEDRGRSFTTDLIEIAERGTGCFKCPHPYCGDEFVRFDELLEHLYAMECGRWVEETEYAGLNYLKTYLS